MPDANPSQELAVLKKMKDALTPTRSPVDASAAAAPKQLTCPHYTLNLVRGDITEQRVDVIVTAANAALEGGGGVDYAVHKAAGPQLLAALDHYKRDRDIRRIDVGTCVLTPAYNLAQRGVKHVAHAVGPRYRDHAPHDAAALLHGAYTTALQAADHEACTSIAFPSISTGVYGYPLEDAAPLALRAIDLYFSQARNLREVVVVAFDAKTHQAFATAADALAAPADPTA